MESSKSSAVDLYSKLGWSVLPVDSNSKKPLIPWMKFQKKKADSFDTHQWSRDFPQAGIAVITGPVSNILVLDADGKEGLEEVKRHGLDKTPTVSTPGGGMHVYYKWPEGMEPFRNTCKLGESRKLDVRGDAAYVLAPYTKRADGKKYEWIQNPINTKLAEVPKWFMTILKTLTKIAHMKLSKIVGPTKAPLKVEELVSLLPARIQKYVREGHDLEIFPSRSECDMAVVVSLLTKGASEEDIEKVFSLYPIGEKYREPDEKGHYLERTLMMAQQRVREVKIKYADPIRYDETNTVRLQVALSSQEGIIRSGLTMPNTSSDVLDGPKYRNITPRWEAFFKAANLEPIPMNYEDLITSSRKLIGKRLRVELDYKNTRSNPVIGFHRI